MLFCWPAILDLTQHAHNALLRAGFITPLFWRWEVQNEGRLWTRIIKVVIVEFSFDAVLCFGRFVVICVEHIFQRVGSWWSVGHVGWFGADAVLAGVSDDSDERLAAYWGLAAGRWGRADGEALGRGTAGFGARRPGAGRRTSAAFTSFHAVVLFDFSEHWTSDVAGPPAAS